MHEKVEEIHVNVDIPVGNSIVMTKSRAAYVCGGQSKPRPLAHRPSCLCKVAQGGIIGEVQGDEK